VHLKGLLLIFIWVKLNGVNRARLYDNVSNGLMSFERTAAINILTLVITLFSVEAQVTA
jgi:hypothetical protein